MNRSQFFAEISADNWETLRLSTAVAARPARPKQACAACVDDEIKRKHVFDSQQNQQTFESKENVDLKNVKQLDWILEKEAQFRKRPKIKRISFGDKN